VTDPKRLADVLTALETVGLNCVVMGGHAVRYYGFNRDTNDFDLHLAPDNWDHLGEALRQTDLVRGQSLVEGISLRPNDFRRFQIGTLASGREEWLEFWKQNHLLAPFYEIFQRREVGSYGGRDIPFLSLRDLIRSKETERECDWADIELLEGFNDARNLDAYAAGKLSLSSALAGIRSRRGFETSHKLGHFADSEAVTIALESTQLSITQAYLVPYAPAAVLPPTSTPIEPVVLKHLRATPPASSMHLSLVEAVRRQYKRAAQAADRADKDTIRDTDRRD
jgi:hypothetical protein